MTDRHSGYIVTLEQDMREDDAEESVLVALRQVKGVLSVEPIVADFSFHMAEQRARRELGNKLWDVLYPAHPGTSEEGK